MAYNIAYQVLQIILPLITAPYVSRVLGVDGVGTYSYIYSIAYYFGLCGMLGVSNHGNRSIAIAKNSDDPKRLSRTFWNIYSIQLITTLIALVSYVVYILFFCSYDKVIAWIAIFFVLSYVLDINWFFFGMEQFKITVVRNTLIKLLTTVCVFIFVNKKSDLWLYVLIMALGMVFSQLYLWIKLRQYISFVKPDFSEMCKNLKPMLILFIPVIAYSIYKVMDKIMLGSMSSVTEVGYYENADKIINIPTGIITAFGTVMMPRIASLVSTNSSTAARTYTERSFKYFSLIAFGMSFGLIGTSEVLAPVYFGEDFAESAPLIQGLSVTIIFMTWANIIRTQYLIPHKKDRPYVVSTIVGSVLNLCCNLTFIPMWGAEGALIGTVIAEFSVFFVQAVYVRKVLSMWRDLKPCILFFVSGLVMAFLVSQIGSIMGQQIITLAVQVLAGFIVYIAISLLLMIICGDKEVAQLLSKAKSRLTH